MAGNRENTKAGATELTEEELGDAQGGTISFNFAKVKTGKKATVESFASPEGPYKRS